jgi:hypothetical protein
MGVHVEVGAADIAEAVASGDLPLAEVLTAVLSECATEGFAVEVLRVAAAETLVPAERWRLQAVLDRLAADAGA